MKSNIEPLIQGITQCTACEFSDGKFKPLTPRPVPIPAEIMFIGENPSWAKGQTSLLDPCTPSGQSLDRNYLEPLGIDRSHVWMTDLFKCRYPKHIHRNKSEYRQVTQHVAETCTEHWLVQEIQLIRPKIVITLSNDEVYQRLRRIFSLATPGAFADAVGKPHMVTIAGHRTLLFPMVHPDICHITEANGKRKIDTRAKWAPLHLQHIGTLKQLLKNTYSWI